MKHKANGRTEPWVARRVAMTKSAAWRMLKLPELRVLERLEHENADHHGKANGRLIVSYQQFLDHMGRNTPKAVAAAIKKLVRLGFLEVVERGKWNDGEGRRASRYRLTYLPTENQPPTDEWRSSLPKREVRNTSEKGTTAH